jgi:isoquinoline 1-oxidoreductase
MSYLDPTAAEWTLAVLAQPCSEEEEWVARVSFGFDVSRRDIIKLLGAGILFAVAETPAFAQQRGRRGGGGFGGGEIANLAARFHLGEDGRITVLTGKVESGQGSRAELTQAAAEELGVAADSLTMIMADTELTPNDGMTAGSRSTPANVPAIRRAAGAVRMLLAAALAKEWEVEPKEITVEGGKFRHAESQKESTYAQLAKLDSTAAVFKESLPENISLTPSKDWRVLGKSFLRPNGGEIVTGKHAFPSDIRREGMLYAKVLRAPAYNSELASVDPAIAEKLPGVSVVHDGSFVAVAAATSEQVRAAIALLAKSATWNTKPHVGSDRLYDHLREKARGGPPKNPFENEQQAAAKSLAQTYCIPYVQHAPMEPRAAVAEWNDDKVTVWTGSQNPFGVRGEIARALRIGEDRVHVIVPDCGGGFGGKHSGEAAVEAARIARAVGKPVSLRWTREEEFTWAYFRPAAVIDCGAALDEGGKIASWYFTNINSGNSAVETPYRVGKTKSQFVSSEPPLRHGSYRALASTANVFARESFMDELANLAGADPLEFRLAHLEDGRLKDVLEKAAREFGWPRAKAERVGYGLACGTEKGSFVAACVEVEIDAQRKIHVREVCQAYECGAILNPDNLRSQVTGAIMMGLGPALREEMIFRDGRMQNSSFGEYRVPRISDLPKLSIHLLDRQDLPSIGAGETPLIVVAPAIANALFAPSGERLRNLPLRLAKA